MKKEVKYSQHGNWVSKTIYIDIETGEIITKKEKEKNYITIKTIKNVNRQSRCIQWTNECRKRKYKQRGLFETNNP